MYVKGFAKIAKPLNGILATGSTNPKKNRNITDQWTPEYQDAFDALKWKLVEAPIPGRLQWAMLPRCWRKFERIISYLRRYVKGFAKIAKPLNGLLGWHPYIYLDDSEPCCLVDASLKGLYHTSVSMLRGLLKLQNHWIVYLPQVLPSPRRTGISPTNGRQSVRMRLMP